MPNTEKVIVQVHYANCTVDINVAGTIITARIRSMTGRYCFHRCLSVNISGGVPGLRFSGGGTWSQIFQGGVPGLRFSGGGGYLVSDFWGGYLVSDFPGGGGTWS